MFNFAPARRTVSRRARLSRGQAIALFAAILALFALAACGRGRQEEPTPFPTSTPIAEAPAAEATAAEATAAEATDTPEPAPAEAAAAESATTEPAAEAGAADASAADASAAEQPESPLQAESPLAPESPMPTPTSIAEALGLKLSSTTGALTGVLITGVTGADQPVPLLQIGLAEVIRDEEGNPKVGGYEPSSAPRTETDASGRFSFSELKPGTYTLIADYVAAQIQLQEGGDGDTILVEIKPNEVTNLGDLRFPKLPMPPK